MMLQDMTELFLKYIEVSCDFVIELSCEVGEDFFTCWGLLRNDQQVTAGSTGGLTFTVKPRWE